MFIHGCSFCALTFCHCIVFKSDKKLHFVRSQACGGGLCVGK